MGYILVFLLIWCIIALIYSKVKSCGFLKANIKMVLGIICLFFDDAASESSFYKQKQMAKKAGRDDVVGKLEQQQCVMQQASDKVHNITDKINNFIDK